MNYIKISRDDIANGPGIRVVLWISGCEHQCEGCHNPDTWNFNQGYPVTNNTIQELMVELGKHYIDGITITGGDPLAATNRKDTMQLISYLSSFYGTSRSIWIYTGYTWEELEEDIQEQLAKTNTTLVDGRFELDRRDITLAHRGSANQRIINCGKSYALNKIITVDLF